LEASVYLLVAKYLLPSKTRYKGRKRVRSHPLAPLAELADAGADVHPKYSDIIWDTIRRQQESIKAKCAVKKVYEHIG